MALPVFLGRADVQQDRALGSAILFYALIDIGAAQKIKKSHILSFLFFCLWL
jgi:hypothetical protein